MQAETIGRAKLVIKNSNNACIFIKDRLSDSFDTVPRPVKHVGTQKYIMSIWNKMMKNAEKYKKDPQTLVDYLNTLNG